VSATSPVTVNLAKLLPALRFMWEVARDDDAGPGQERPVVALGGTLVSAGGPDFGVLVTVPGEAFPSAIVDLEHLLQVVERSARFGRPWHVNAWCAAGHLTIHGAATWSLPLRPPPRYMAELAPSAEDLRVAIPAPARHSLARAMTLAWNAIPARAPVLETVHIRARNTTLVAEAISGPVAVAYPLCGTAMRDVDILITDRLARALDGLDCGGITVTDTHAATGSGPRRATVVDAVLVDGSTVTAWSLTPAGRFPNLDQFLGDPTDPFWSHPTTSGALNRAVDDLLALGSPKTWVSLSAGGEREVVALATFDGHGSAPLTGSFFVGPQVWVRLDLLARAVRLLPDGVVTVSGKGPASAVHLTHPTCHVAVESAIPRANADAPPQAANEPQS
jgi:hypothetical protein